MLSNLLQLGCKNCWELPRVLKEYWLIPLIATKFVPIIWFVVSNRLLYGMFTSPLLLNSKGTIYKASIPLFIIIFEKSPLDTPYAAWLISLAIGQLFTPLLTFDIIFWSKLFLITDSLRFRWKFWNEVWVELTI
jgi:hypothetical protein